MGQEKLLALYERYINDDSDFSSVYGDLPDESLAEIDGKLLELMRAYEYHHPLAAVGDDTFFRAAMDLAASIKGALLSKAEGDDFPNDDSGAEDGSRFPAYGLAHHKIDFEFNKG